MWIRFQEGLQTPKMVFFCETLGGDEDDDVNMLGAVGWWPLFTARNSCEHRQARKFKSKISTRCTRRNVDGRLSVIYKSE